MSGGSLSTAGAMAGSLSAGDDDHQLPHELALGGAAVNLVTIQDRKDQAILALKADLMARLNKEVKSLDEDCWMFDGPRSRIHLISGPGGLQHRRTDMTNRLDTASRKIM